MGISAGFEDARWSYWEARSALLPRHYIDAVQRAGAIALVVPPDEAAATNPGDFLDRIDGLIVSGGADIETDPERDRFEVTLAEAAIGRGMPLLGICRGMELLNVACGGTLIQHLPDVLGSDRHREQRGVFGVHEVRLAAGSLAARAVGAERATVRSHHHQGLDGIGEGLVASGWSVADDIVEAIEVPEHPFCLGVLWHPEEDVESRVVGALVDAARAKATT